MSSKIIFITGATAGFGKAIAYKFASHGFDLILNGRRTERLRKIEAEISEQYKVRVLTLPFDVTDEESVNAAVQSLPHDWKSIDILVNKCRLAAGLSTIQEGKTGPTGI